ncbi:Cytochrome b5- protein [Chytridiales sp. JEL 0842]|nr:Cytochrome b5- protein [Chytridiales sp. JEL 0842]
MPSQTRPSPPNKQPPQESNNNDHLGFPTTLTNRNYPLHSTLEWHRGKGHDERVPKHLWRIHDAYYDLSGFAERHPGGSFWIAQTQGTDVTEAFESMHPDPSVLGIEKYIVDEKPSGKRLSPLTFKEGGLYKTFRRRVGPILKALKKGEVRSGRWRSRLVFDGLVGVYVLGMGVSLAMGGSWLAMTVVGVCMAGLMLVGHNFFHQRDNLRMYLFNLGGLSSHEWRTSHALSHHLFPNTRMDMEVALVEPFLSFVPLKTKFYQHPLLKPFALVVTILYANIIFVVGVWISLLLNPLRLLEAAWFYLFERAKVKGSMNKMRLVSLRSLFVSSVIPFLEIATYISLRAFLSPTQSVGVAWIAFKEIMYAFSVGSWIFLGVGAYTSHHHELVWKQNDSTTVRPPTIKEMPPVDKSKRQAEGGVDFALFQLLVTKDKVEPRSSFAASVSTFSDHQLHHLLPTVDHGDLDLMYPVFEKVCQEFGIEGVSSVLSGGQSILFEEGSGVNMDVGGKVRWGRSRAVVEGLLASKEEEKDLTSKEREEVQGMPFGDGQYLTYMGSAEGFYRGLIRSERK